MRVAVEGCCHGELDNIYATLQQAQASDGIPIDLLLICGDFQAMRNYSDLQTLACPEKYRHMGSFYKYYSGEKVAPMLTLVIGGNHEASNYMWELFHGGWLAPNIYYLGAAGSVLVNGIRISGASGIYKSGDYRKGRFERQPYDKSTIRSIYHTREYDISRLAQLATVNACPSIFLSHDWPLEIERYGDTNRLLRAKPFFRDEINSNTLGSPPLRGLLQILKPNYWFSAHLHVKFPALFKHNKQPTLLHGKPISQQQQHQNSHNAQPAPQAKNPDELLIDDEEEEEAVVKSGNPDEVAIVDSDDEAGAAPAKVHNADEIAIDDEDMNGEADDLIHPKHPEPTLTDHLPSNSIDESATVKEGQAGVPDKTANTDEILIDDDEEDKGALQVAKPEITEVQAKASSLNREAEATKFLALSKCLPGQDFLQIFDIPTASDSSSSSAQGSSSSPKLTFDPIWLAITRAFHPLLSLSYRQDSLPRDTTVCKAMISKELDWLRTNLFAADKNEEGLEIEKVQQFVQTAPHPGQEGGQNRAPGPWYTNPQTEALCALLGIQNKVNPVPK